MASPAPSVTQARARLAGMSKPGHDPALVASARRDLAYAVAYERLTRVYDELTTEHRAQLAAYLLSGGSRDA